MPLRSFFSRFVYFVLGVAFLQWEVAAVTAPSDVAALVAIKAAVHPSSIAPWSCLASWDFTASDPCASPRRTHFVCGVACDDVAGVSRVTAVVLVNSMYEGLLSAAVGNLSRLVHLDLSGNNLRGRLPASLGSLPALRTLSLFSNAFSGEIPTSIANLRSLEVLDVSGNTLKGAVPAALAGLVSLRNLDMSYNRLSGGLPALPPNLVSLALRGNALKGPITASAFAGLGRLEVVELAANRITGTLDGWFLRLPALQQANLANNTLVGLSLGEPTTPGRDAGSPLVALDLGFNRIDGKLPPELGGFPALTSLTLRQNRLKGAIPFQYYAGKKGSPFRRLFLDGNFLNGKVPDVFIGAVTGSFGDNCLEGCPAAEQLCQPLQKPAEVCKEVYGVVDGGRRRRAPHHPMAASPVRSNRIIIGRGITLDDPSVAKPYLMCSRKRRRHRHLKKMTPQSWSSLSPPALLLPPLRLFFSFLSPVCSFASTT